MQDVADDLGATPSQVAIAWTMAHSSAVHPILGARRLDQLLDNLGAADCKLPPHALARLEESATFTIGFPTDFLAEIESWVFAKRPPHAPIHRGGRRDRAPSPRSAMARLADRNPQNAPGDW